MDLSNKTILICDDSILARKQLKDAICSFTTEANIIEATNGDEACVAYSSDKPDIVFLDIVMPVMDGNTALNKIMEMDKDAIIIVVSSIGTQAQLKDAISNGAKDFIQKPFDPNQLKTILETRLGGN